MNTSASRRARLGAGVLAVVSGLVLAGCSTSVDEASDEYCAKLDDLRGELTSVTSLVNGDVTLDGLEEKRDAVRDAFQEVESSGGDLDQAVSEELEAAQDEFREAVEAIPGDASPTEAAGEYASAVQGYLSDLRGVAEDAGCNDS